MRQGCRGDRDEIVVTRLLIIVYYKSSLFLNPQNLSGESAEISIYKDEGLRNVVSKGFSEIAH